MEFVQSISPTSSCTTQWKIYKVKQITEKTIWIEIDDYLSTTTNFLKEKSKPSTESAYIEQLKAEAFIRFGEIKEGDRFDSSEMGYSKNASIAISRSSRFYYLKECDALKLCGFILYQKGKWATRLKERVKVENIDRNWSGNPDVGFKFKFKFKVDNGGSNVCMIKAGDFLASKLEEYLNKE